MTSAPSARNCELNPLVCLRVRVTTIRLPKSGRFSNQFKSFRRETTSPKIATAGASKPAALACSAIFSRVPTIVFCWPTVPRWTSATGRFFWLPCANISRVIAANRSAPINITWVPPSLASASKSIALSPFVGSSWPVKKVTCEFWSR